MIYNDEVAAILTDVLQIWPKHSSFCHNFDKFVYQNNQFIPPPLTITTPPKFGSSRKCGFLGASWITCE